MSNDLLKGNRKLIFAALAVIASTVAVAFGWVGPTDWRTVMVVTIGAFVGGNYGEHRERERNGNGS